MTEMPRRTFAIIMMNLPEDGDELKDFGSAIVPSRIHEFKERLSITGRFFLWLKFMKAANHAFGGAYSAAKHSEYYK